MILHIYDPFWAALQINSTCRKSFTFGEGILDSWTPCVPVVFPPLALTHDMKKFKPPPEEGMLDSWAPVSLSCSLLPPRHNATSLVEGRGGGGGLEWIEVDRKPRYEALQYIYIFKGKNFNAASFVESLN